MVSRVDLANQRARQLISDMRDLPEWRRRTAERHADRKDDEVVQRLKQDTFFGRHHQAFLCLLNEHILPALDKSAEFPILDVGIGGAFHGSAEPWELLALLLGAGGRPKLTIVEEDPQVIGRFRAADKIVSGDNSLGHYRGLIEEDAFKTIFAYARRVARQFGAVVSGDKDSFLFLIPPSARELIAGIHNEDIVLWPPSESELGIFSLAVALNVSIYVRDAAVPLAFLNVFERVKPGGWALFSGGNDNALFLESPLMEEFLGYRLLFAEGDNIIRYLAIRKNHQAPLVRLA